jgi:hypothetical protein
MKSAARYRAQVQRALARAATTADSKMKQQWLAIAQRYKILAGHAKRTLKRRQ